MKSAIKWCLAGFQILHSPQAPFLLLSACSEPHSTTGCTDGDGEEPLDCFVVLTKNTQRILTCTKFNSHTAHLWISKLNIQQATESLVFIPELWNSSQWGNQEQTGPKTHGTKLGTSIQTCLSAALPSPLRAQSGHYGQKEFLPHYRLLEW